MKFSVVVSAMLIMALLVGCGSSEPETVSVDFSFISQKDLSIPDRDRWTAAVTAKDLESKAQVMHLATAAATNLLTSKQADVVSVSVELTPELAGKGCPLATASFSPDRKGWSGDNSSARWDVRLIKSWPSDNDMLAVLAWYRLRGNHLTDGLVDEDQLKQAITKATGLTADDIHTGLFNLCGNTTRAPFDDLSGISGWLEKALSDN